MGNSQSRKPYRRKYLVGEREEFWVDMQPFLLQRGYKLRPRYDPLWKPSWKKFGHFNVSSWDREDGITINRTNVMDAVRMSDGLKVVLKVVETRSKEIPILQYLNSEAVRADPRNKTVPLLDVIMIPQTDATALIVMPILLGFSELPFRYVGEFCEAYHQFLLGLVFMHEHKIAHRDACFLNLMMDSSKVIPNGFHFGNWIMEDGVERWIKWVDRRSVAPVNYYFIDFGLSCKFHPRRTDTRAIGKVGQDRTVPEMSNESFYDPFKTDVYQLGNILPKIYNNYEGLKMFQPLSDAMTCQDPNQRPSAAQAYDLFLDVMSSLTEDDLNRRIWHNNASAELRYRVEFCNENPVEFAPCLQSAFLQSCPSCMTS
ncbi:hypothetical protein BDZ97DRAFT_1858275 [Flammula alnicola]|nr:hypothetical protein BDZ97DRAFT_1858275 [Flammula alnicola]